MGCMFAAISQYHAASNCTAKVQQALLQCGGEFAPYAVSCASAILCFHAHAADHQVQLSVNVKKADYHKETV